ncbi:MAG: prepilin-type N-terminal cleavage/methylation domain-containing protein, partial [bacterium]|nr:prepilin-type N-terminal cleavage/methylation domain-containing protein [bacterium]
MMSPGSRHRAGRNNDLHGRGYTLVELVLSLAIMSIVMAGTASVAVIASHALPSTESPDRAVTRGCEVLRDIAGELLYATSITENSTAAVTFAVADRGHGAAGPETVRYAWSGSPGDPLTRQYNGGSVVDLIQDVSEFDLSYDLKVVAEEQPSVDLEGAEIELSSHQSVNAGNSFSITASDWIGQYFQPSLPADAISWKVTRVMIEAQSRGQADGETLVQLRPAISGNLPAGSVLEQLSMIESDLTTVYTWQEFSFANVSGLAPGSGLCLVLQHVADATSANVRFDNATGPGCLDTGDGGSSWTYYGTRAMNYYVYGTVTTPSAPAAVTKQWLLSVGIKLRVGPDPATGVETAFQVLNEPEV